jgi:hypothetical protein
VLYPTLATDPHNSLRLCHGRNWIPNDLDETGIDIARVGGNDDGRSSFGLYARFRRGQFINQLGPLLTTHPTLAPHPPIGCRRCKNGKAVHPSRRSEIGDSGEAFLGWGGAQVIETRTRLLPGTRRSKLALGVCPHCPGQQRAPRVPA